MKKRTLNQTWVLCLRMWRSISKRWKENNIVIIYALKEQWLATNGFDCDEIDDFCFFCDFAAERGCSQCPGRLVNPDFDCMNPDYDYGDEPVAFYKELLRLNRIRKANK